MEQKGETTTLYEEAGVGICSNGIINEIHCEKSSDATSLSSGRDGNSNMSEVVPALLPEIISDILSRLPIEDIMRFKIVSKDWYALTKDPHFIDMHFRRALCLPPRIILEPGSEGAVNSLHLIGSEKGIWRGREIPIENMQGEYMLSLCFCHGLLCVASSGSVLDPLCIYNPITRESLELPKTDLKLEECTLSIGFGFDPSSKRYKVVRLFKFYQDYNPQSYMRGEIITLGEGSWRELEVSHAVVCSTDARPVFLDGAIHWLIDIRCHHASSDFILVLDLCDEKFRTIKFPVSLICSITFPHEVFLLNLRGSLYLVEHGYWEHLCVWRIARSTTKKGYKFYQSSYCMTMTDRALIWNIALKDKLIDNSFMFHVRHINLTATEESATKDHLALYYPEQDEYHIVKASGFPESFQPFLFVPCLVSPNASVLNRDQQVNSN